MKDGYVTQFGLKQAMRTGNLFPTSVGFIGNTFLGTSNAHNDTTAILTVCSTVRQNY